MLRHSFQDFIFLCAFATLCLLYSRCNANKLRTGKLLLPGFNRPASLKGTTTAINGTDDGDMTPNFVSCWDEGVPMIDNVPSPVSCKQYYSCRVKGTPHSPDATPMECPLGHDRQLLTYDFRRCQFNYKENAECFDGNDESHILDFYMCAHRYIPAEN